jgi:hypothetical protein
MTASAVGWAGKQTPTTGRRHCAAHLTVQDADRVREAAEDAGISQSAVISALTVYGLRHGLLQTAIAEDATYLGSGPLGPRRQPATSAAARSPRTSSDPRVSVIVWMSVRLYEALHHAAFAQGLTRSVIVRNSIASALGVDRDEQDAVRDRLSQAGVV